MKFLCLAYGAEEDWNRLSKQEQDALLAQDERIRQRGTLMGAVKPEVTTVRAWDGAPQTSPVTLFASSVPLAGFSILEADSLAEAVDLVAQTPCARAQGAIEIRPILMMNAPPTASTGSPQ
jgi:hypothetical protein